jgi:DNA invertase Pin-like site-specific DNA recombinase
MFQVNEDIIRSIGRPQAIRAAAYVRMSTDLQKYSIDSQLGVIRSYAATHGMEIVRIYRDDGRSGLTIGGRLGLQSLLDDVCRGTFDFSTLLIYDISRWGRWQNLDEAAYYEHTCARAGIRVIYCAEPFENDGSMVSTLLKMIGRMGAAKYSSDLSTKIFLGHCQALARGTWPAAIPGAGVRRCIVGKDGNAKAILERGQRKYLREDSIVLVPGPTHEVAEVRRIYELFVYRGLNLKDIARTINGERASAQDRLWTDARVSVALRNEMYIGNLVYARCSAKLGTRLVRNPPQAWVRCENALPAIVPRELFDKAQAEIRRRAQRYSNEFLLERLAGLLRRKGELSTRIIDEDSGTPCSSYYTSRFGTMREALAMVGYCRIPNYDHYDGQRRVREGRVQLMAALQRRLKERGVPFKPGPRVFTLLLNEEFTVLVDVAYCRTKNRKQLLWRWRHERRSPADISLLGRMAPDNTELLDLYAIPFVDLSTFPRTLMRHNSPSVDAYRVRGLDDVVEFGQRVPLKELVR